MNSKLSKEIPAILLSLLPMAYLCYLWNTLPERVPMHWNIEGEIDRYGDKSELLWLVILLPTFIYALFLIIPMIDPKKKIELMGNKYQSLKNIIVGFVSLILIIVLYSVKNQAHFNPNWIFIAVGLLFMALGNYFKTIRPNYFIGIRTPWTLENETVWKDTHVIGGKIWFVGGLLMVLLSISLHTKASVIIILIITAILVLVPIVYSYIRFKQISQES